MVGITDSTYHACQAFTWEKIIDMGDRIDSNDPILAAELFIHVEDGRHIGHTETLCL